MAYDGDRLAAAVCVVDLASMSTVESKVVSGRTDFPYVPGLFAYRELPSLRAAIAELDTVPDVLVCDGHGLAHPRRFGLACHLGVLTGSVTTGVAKSAGVDAPSTGNHPSRRPPVPPNHARPHLTHT